MKHAFGAPVMHFAYRFMTDDWGIDSHTGEVRLRWPLGRQLHRAAVALLHAERRRTSIAPASSAAQRCPQYASADFRLGNFDATTVGLKYGHGTASGNEWSARVEYYQQNGSVPREQIVGNQANREQYPDLNAIIVQFGYRFGL